MGLYEVLWYSSWDPCYFLIDGIEGDTPEKALRDNLERLTAEIRERYDLSLEDVPDEDIHEALYVLRDDGLVSGLDALRAFPVNKPSPPQGTPKPFVNSIDHPAQDRKRRKSQRGARRALKSES